jgi:hypothetical protein
MLSGYVKALPSNQTLLLASDRSARFGAAPLARRATGSPSSGAVLEAITVVAALPDDTLVYLRADFAARQEGSSGRVVAIQPQSPGSTKDDDARGAQGNPESPNRQIALYPQTQRLLDVAPTAARLDVHA